MTNKIYFIADLHFGHTNILRHSPKRPYSDTVDIAAHDEWLLDLWRSTVDKRDTIYILGDLTFLKSENARHLLEKLPGHIPQISRHHRHCSPARHLPARHPHRPHAARLVHLLSLLERAALIRQLHAQGKGSHTIHHAPQGDLQVDEKYLFEVGGRKKGFTQIADIPDSYVVADGIETGYGNKIPLWLFGLIY